MMVKVSYGNCNIGEDIKIILEEHRTATTAFDKAVKTQVGSPDPSNCQLYELDHIGFPLGGNRFCFGKWSKICVCPVCFEVLLSTLSMKKHI